MTRDDDLNTARGILTGLLISIAIWITLIFAALAIVSGWPYTLFVLAGICAIFALREGNQ